MRSGAEMQPFRRQFMVLFRRAVRFGLACAVLSYVLAIPVIDLVVVMELRQPDELCIDNDTSGFGMWLEEDGKKVCKFLARRIMLFWSFSAVLASPLAIAWIYLRRQVRRTAEQAGPKSLAWRGDRFARAAGIAFLLVLTSGTLLTTLLFL